MIDKEINCTALSSCAVDKGGVSYKSFYFFSWRVMEKQNKPKG